MATNEAWSALVKAQREKGSNCLSNPDAFCPPEDEDGHTPLPTPEEAAMLCYRCPLLGKECRMYAATLPRKVGVLDGKVYDDWGDQPMIEDDEEGAEL